LKTRFPLGRARGPRSDLLLSRGPSRRGSRTRGPDLEPAFSSPARRDRLARSDAERKSPDMTESQRRSAPFADVGLCRRGRAEGPRALATATWDERGACRLRFVGGRPTRPRHFERGESGRPPFASASSNARFPPCPPRFEGGSLSPPAERSPPRERAAGPGEPQDRRGDPQYRRRASQRQRCLPRSSPRGGPPAGAAGRGRVSRPFRPSSLDADRGPRSLEQPESGCEVPLGNSASRLRRGGSSQR